MQLVNGSTDVTTYFVLRDSTAHAPKTDVTITDIDVYYLEQGAAMAAKVDLTALAAADSAHADSKGYHCGQGLYRIDWPDAAFDGGIGKKVYLAVVCTGVDTEYREVELVAANTGDSYARLGAPAGASIAADLVTLDNFVDTEVAAILAAVDTEVAAIKAKTDSLTFTVAGVVDSNLTHVGGTAASGVATVDANVTTIANGAITAAAIATGAIDADALAADAGTEIGAAVKTAIEAAGSHLTLILEDTGTTLPTAIADLPTNAELATALATAWTVTTIAEDYPADGAAATPAELLYLILSVCSQFSISGTTLTSQKLDGTTTAATYTLDSATAPTSRVRAS